MLNLLAGRINTGIIGGEVRAVQGVRAIATAVATSRADASSAGTAVPVPNHHTPTRPQIRFNGFLPPKKFGVISGYAPDRVNPVRGGAERKHVAGIADGRFANAAPVR